MAHVCIGPSRPCVLTVLEYIHGFTTLFAPMSHHRSRAAVHGRWSEACAARRDGECVSAVVSRIPTESRGATRRCCNVVAGTATRNLTTSLTKPD